MLRHDQQDGSPPPQVTVVVAAYDAGAYLAESLQSLRAQSVTTWECVVVDDGSGDDTAAVAASFAVTDSRFRVVSQPNLGTPTARNVGIALASPSSSCLAFLDADDVWLPDALQTLLTVLDDHPEAVGAYGLAEYIDAGGHPLDVGRHSQGQRNRRQMGRLDLVDVPPEDPYTFDSLIVSGTMWPTAVALHRRFAVERVGGFDRTLRQVQDWDLYLRMSRFGPFVPVDRQVVWYRQHPANVTKRADRVAFYSLTVRHKAFTSGDDTPRQHRQSRRIWRRLVLRWMVWTLMAAGRELRRGRFRAAATAAAAATRFTLLLLVGHPVAANSDLAASIARYTAERAAVARC